MFCYLVVQDSALLLSPPGRYLVDVGARGRAATRWCSTLCSPPLDPPGRYHMPASSDVILRAVARPGGRGRHVLGQREGLERRKKEVRKWRRVWRKWRSRDEKRSGGARREASKPFRVSNEDVRWAASGKPSSLVFATELLGSMASGAWRRDRGGGAGEGREIAEFGLAAAGQGV